MKKILSIIMICIMFVSPVNVFAETESQTGSIAVSYEVDGTYILSIPSSVNVGEEFTLSVTEYNISSSDSLRFRLSNILDGDVVRLYNNDDIENGLSEDDSSYVDIAVYDTYEDRLITTTAKTLGYIRSVDDTIILRTEYVSDSDGQAGTYSGSINIDVDCVTEG